MEGLASLKAYCEESIKKYEKIEKHLGTVRKKIEEEAPKEVAKLYYQVAANAVLDFYNDYSPSVYKRTFQLYNAYTVDIEKGEYPDHVRFTPDNMFDTHGESNEHIIDVALRHGWHGSPEIYVSESPMDVIDKKVQELYNAGFKSIIDDLFNKYI